MPPLTLRIIPIAIDISRKWQPMQGQTSYHADMPKSSMKPGNAKGNMLRRAYFSAIQSPPSFSPEVRHCRAKNCLPWVHLPPLDSLKRLSASFRFLRMGLNGERLLRTYPLSVLKYARQTPALHSSLLAESNFYRFHRRFPHYFLSRRFAKRLKSQSLLQRLNLPKEMKL